MNNLSYKKCLELKKAGFPQTLTGNDHYECGHHFNDEAIAMLHRSDCEGWVKFPTLEELIEACGDGFQSMKHSKNTWRIYMPNRTNTGFEENDYSTPKEAVANLYLELKKK